MERSSPPAAVCTVRHHHKELDQRAITCPGAMPRWSYTFSPFQSRHVVPTGKPGWFRPRRVRGFHPSRSTDRIHRLHIINTGHGKWASAPAHCSAWQVDGITSQCKRACTPKTVCDLAILQQPCWLGTNAYTPAATALRVRHVSLARLGMCVVIVVCIGGHIRLLKAQCRHESSSHYLTLRPLAFVRICSSLASVHINLPASQVYAKCTFVNPILPGHNDSPYNGPATAGLCTQVCYVNALTRKIYPGLPCSRIRDIFLLHTHAPAFVKHPHINQRPPPLALAAMSLLVSQPS